MNDKSFPDRVGMKYKKGTLFFIDPKTGRRVAMTYRHAYGIKTISQMHGQRNIGGGRYSEILFNCHTKLALIGRDV